MPFTYSISVEVLLIFFSLNIFLSLLSMLIISNILYLNYCSSILSNLSAFTISQSSCFYPLVKFPWWLFTECANSVTWCSTLLMIWLQPTFSSSFFPHLPSWSHAFMLLWSFSLAADWRALCQPQRWDKIVQSWVFTCTLMPSQVYHGSHFLFLYLFVPMHYSFCIPGIS